MNWKNS